MASTVKKMGKKGGRRAREVLDGDVFSRQLIRVTSKTTENEDTLGIKISPRLLWVAPFIRKAKGMMPGLKLPTQIRSFKPVKNKIMRVYANIYFETKIISLSTHTQQMEATTKGPRVKKIVALPKAEILDTLAHELAHLHYPEHGYEHSEFTKTIFRTFGLKQKCPHCKGAGKVPVESKP